MAATMIKCKLCRRRSLLISDSMFNFRNIRELTCLFVVVCAMLSQSSADDGYERTTYDTEDFLKREYSLTKPYQGVGFSSSSHWDLMGTAMITPEHVRLTPDLQSRQGAVWSRFPCYIRDWELQVHFKIHGQGKKNLNGDGMAFWFTKERMNVGPAFGNVNQFTGLGVFVDTYPNQDKNHERGFPYISVMLGNGTLQYDHSRDGRTTELGGCTALVRNVNHDTFFLLRYYRNRLTLMIDIDGKREWKDCVDISGLRLPLGYHFGASSATGDLSDNHDLISMKLYQLTAERTPEEEEEEDVIIPMVENMTPFQVEVEEEETSGVQVFFTLFFSIVGLCVLGAIALMVYNRWKENSRKRFY